MSILVTGGAGYIGSHTVRQLVSRGETVVVLDSLEFGHRASIGAVPLVVGTTADRDLISSTIRDHGVDAIIHFAAYKAAGESMEQPERYFRNNVAGTLTLLEAAHAEGVRHLVFSSTCAVYGTPTLVPVAESAPLGPESPYGESKLMCEQMLRWWDVCHGLRYASLRYFNAAGASHDASIGEDWTVSLNLVPIVMKAILERGPALTVFGTDYPTPDGTAIRDYIHVDDLADAHLRSLDRLRGGADSFVLNLGTGQGSSVQQVIDTAEAVSGHVVPRTYSGRRMGDPVCVFADNRAAVKLLGWRPEYGLGDIVASAWRWHSTHPDGLDGSRRNNAD